MSEITEVLRPAPYKVDLPIHKVQTLVQDGKEKFLFRHDFSRLDASNVDLLYKREKDTKRITEKLAKGKTRARLKSEDADMEFYRALVQSGGWRPYGLEAKTEEGLIQPSMRDYYSLNNETNLWEPGWVELDKSTMLSLTAEKMSEAIERWLLCNARKIASGTIDFMFEKAGIMEIVLDIGDIEEPAYKLPFEMRRPDSKRRTKFKEDFAYMIDESKNGMGNVRTIMDLRQAIGFFDEYFATCPDDPEYSPIVFTDKRDFSEQGRTPEPISAVALTSEEPEINLPVRAYSEELHQEMISLLNPHYKVEVSAATIQAFSRTDQEL